MKNTARKKTTQRFLFLFMADQSTVILQMKLNSMFYSSDSMNSFGLKWNTINKKWSSILKSNIIKIVLSLSSLFMISVQGYDWWVGVGGLWVARRVGWLWQQCGWLVACFVPLLCLTSRSWFQKGKEDLASALNSDSFWNMRFKRVALILFFTNNCLGGWWIFLSPLLCLTPRSWFQRVRADSVFAKNPATTLNSDSLSNMKFKSVA